MECVKKARDFNRDATQIPARQKPKPNPTLTSSLYCGCPEEKETCLWDCQLPGEIQTRFLRQPRQCVKQPCNFMIPAIPCSDVKEVREPGCNPLCFDWTVNEPGPNDSYGLNGLNWHDWEMEEINKYNKQPPTRGYTPIHPGYSKIQAPATTPIYQCQLPIECYSRMPGPLKKEEFATDVNYFRDWRCCEAKPPRSWRPPYAQWATNQSL